jgi:hypothetical protein
LAVQQNSVESIAARIVNYIIPAVKTNRVITFAAIVYIIRPKSIDNIIVRIFLGLNNIRVYFIGCPDNAIVK